MLYGKTLFQSESLKKCAEKYLKALPKDITCLVSTGTSGCSLASAMLVLSKRKLRHWYVRKARDDGHSEYVIGVHSNRDSFAIIDDFINSGGTIRRIIKGIETKGEYNKKNIKCIIVDYCDSGNNFDEIKLIQVCKQKK